MRSELAREVGRTDSRGSGQIGHSQGRIIKSLFRRGEGARERWRAAAGLLVLAPEAVHKAVQQFSRYQRVGPG